MFTKEVIALAKPFNEALKKIAERQEKKCPRCKGQGELFQLPSLRGLASRTISCPKCNGTGTRKWEWEPEVGDACIDHWHNEPMVIYAVEEDKQTVYASRFTATDESNGYRQDIKHLTPLLHWERILLILRDLGFTVGITLGQTSGALVIYHERIKMEALHKSINLNKVQPVVMQAVIELGKESSNEKD